MTLREFNKLRPGSRIQKTGNKTSHEVRHIEDVQFLNFVDKPASIRKYREIVVRGRGRTPSITLSNYYKSSLIVIADWEVVIP